MHRLNAPLVALAFAAMAAGCEQEQQPTTNDGGEDLTIVVEADKSRILQEEQELRKKRESFEQERERLAREKAAIEAKLASLSKKDKKEREQLEAEQRRLLAEERRVREQAQQFEAERKKLQAEKNALLERIAKLSAKRGGLTLEQREQLMAQRERTVAEREQKLAERERRLAAREAELGARLQRITEKLAELGTAALVQPSTSAPVEGGGAGPAVTRASVSKLERQVRLRMHAKGLLPDDLPPTAKELQDNARRAIEAKDHESAQQALLELLGIIDGIQINGAFVKAKMARINRLYAQKKPSEQSQKQIAALIAEVSEATTDGRFDRANKKINQISALLQK